MQASLLELLQDWQRKQARYNQCLQELVVDGLDPEARLQELVTQQTLDELESLEREAAEAKKAFLAAIRRSKQG